MSSLFKRAIALAVTGVLLTAVLAGCALKDDDSKGTVKLAYVNWSEGIAMTHLVASILEDEMDYKVDLTLADIAPVFTSVSSGNTDVFLDSWLPVTHKHYMDKYGDKVEVLGDNYEDARLGLAVPTYVDIDSIEDLNDNKDLFGGEIIGIDSGASTMDITQEVIDEYGLEFELIAGSEPTMTTSLKKAYDAGEPIVVVAWTPHWKFAKWDLKMLDDPKVVYGDGEQIKTVARKGFSEDMPEVAEFLTNFFMSEQDLGDLMDKIESSDDGDPMKAARAWKNDNKEIIEKWIPATQE